MGKNIYIKYLSGFPCPYLLSVFAALTLVKKDGQSIPVVYNTNGYELPEFFVLVWVHRKNFSY